MLSSSVERKERRDVWQAHTMNPDLYPAEIAAKTSIPVDRVRFYLRWKPGQFKRQCGRI